jgi:hypothetical protein
MSGPRTVTAWLLIGAGAIAAALATQQASSEASAANGQWQESVRAETRYTAATLENIRKVYVDDAPLAFQVRAALISAEELQRQAAAQPSLSVEAEAQRRAAQRFIDAFSTAGPDANPLLRDHRYTKSPGGAPYVARLLADLQARNRDTAAALAAEGDRNAADSERGTWGMVAGALIVLAGFVLWRSSASPEPPRDTPRRRRRPAVSVIALAAFAVDAVTTVVRYRHTRAVTDDPPDVPLNPPGLTVGTPDPGDSRSPLPGVLLAVLVTAVTALQIQAGTEENRQLADAARRASVVAATASGGVSRAALTSNGKQFGLLVGQRADELETAGETARAAADEAAGARISRLATAMGAAPTAADGADPATRAIVDSSRLALADLGSGQSTAVTAAEEAGNRSDLLVLVLFLLTLVSAFAEIGYSFRLSDSVRNHDIERSVVNNGLAFRFAAWLICAAAIVLALHALI